MLVFDGVAAESLRMLGWLRGALLFDGVAVESLRLLGWLRGCCCLVA